MKKTLAIYLFDRAVDQYQQQANSDRVAESKRLSMEIEDDCIRVCRHFPECPFTPPAGDADCPGCRASEQYLDDSCC